MLGSVSLSFGLINSYHHLIYLALQSFDFAGLELTNSVPNYQDPYVRNKNVPVKKSFKWHGINLFFFQYIINSHVNSAFCSLLGSLQLLKESIMRSALLFLEQM